ncbi:MAG TPA: DNA primase DnaG [Methanospirillum sp.]|uniref:DNA primase DnaG n=1 Tax=Methanospirillum sp. TaxID=45200 RepID=UPI002C100A26|nr:DNA primase DnaG [Methanospirillum sp.]HOJ96878.1 DNA primase DnaG [Methanospirillum sp.]
MHDQDTTKYRIHLVVQADGVVDRSDVVGAIFGQIEGLLGSELELRELQRQGKLGRIDVKIQSKMGKSYGEITIPTSVDRAETAILAASMETINRVGPCTSEIHVQSIEDVRITKRTQIIERAKALLLEFEEPGIDPDSLIDAVRESQRIEKIATIGPDNVPAGPNVLVSDAIIVVEGRADVINLLRAGIKNAVAVEGTSIPKTIIDLCRKKTATAFFDGDRGGDLILRELLEITDVDFVAYPPRGESVEDLSRKEIIKALRNKVPIEYVLEDRVSEYLLSQKSEPIVRSYPGQEGEEVLSSTSEPVNGTDDEPVFENGSTPAEDEIISCECPDERDPAVRETDDAEEETRPRTVFSHIREVKNRGTARLIGPGGEVKNELSAGEIEEKLGLMDDDLEGVVIDQEVTQQLLDQFTMLGIRYLAAPSFTGIVRMPATIRLIPFR